MKRLRLWMFGLSTLGISATLSVATAQTVLFEEDFDTLMPTLQNSVNERVGTAIVTVPASQPETTAIPGVWSATTPGWTTDNTLSTYNGMPTVTPGVPGVGVADFGVDEWEGWRFANKSFWAAVDDQQRSSFGTTSGASGTIAVADPDEYFDLGGGQNHPVHGGYYSSSLVSPTFPVVASGFYGVGFDSSWRPESFDDAALGDTILSQNNQAIEIIAVFNNGSTQVVRWNSDPADPNYKSDATDQHFPADGSQLFFEAPAGATEATLRFNIANAANDWWWAVDNIQVNDLTGAAGTVLMEDFEDTPLGDSVNERLGAGARVTGNPGSSTTILGTDYPTTARPSAFTHNAPANWTRDVTIDLANEGDNNVGVYEWEGWSFTTRDFWNFADRQGREQFDNGSGVIAVADGDEWTDLGSPTGKLFTLLKTPEIDLTGIGGDLLLEFDSSYRSEGGQFVKVLAYFDGDTANPVELLSRDGSSGDFVNEAVSLMVDPMGAGTVSFAFSYEGGNNWWWAIDNIKVSTAAVPEPASVLIVMSGIGLLGAMRLRRR
jgi:nitrogen fixation-related uncharacterized protein